MPSTTAILSELLSALRSPTTRLRTGLWLASPQDLTAITDIGARLGVGTVDLRQQILSRLQPGQRFLGIGEDDFVLLIDEIIHTPLTYDARLLYHLDLLLARFTRAQRDDIWDRLYQGLPHRPHALILAMPHTADHLLPVSSQLATWRMEGRLVDTTPHGG